MWAVGCQKQAQTRFLYFIFGINLKFTILCEFDQDKTYKINAKRLYLA